LAQAVSDHWGVENGLHWHLDVTPGEDACRVKKDHGPENLSRLNKIVLALLKLAPLANRPARSACAAAG